MRQLDIFRGEELRDQGIQKSLDHANSKIDSWGESAYIFLNGYALKHNIFMAEDVRVASQGIVEVPPSKRAWGAVFVKAKKNKLIKSKGFGTVKNPNAHRTPATIWKSLIYEND